MNSKSRELRMESRGFVKNMGMRVGHQVVRDCSRSSHGRIQTLGLQIECLQVAKDLDAKQGDLVRIDRTIEQVIEWNDTKTNEQLTQILSVPGRGPSLESELLPRLNPRL